MYQASTPLIRFLFPVDPDDAKDILISFTQNRNVILDKHKSDLTMLGEVTKRGKNYYGATLRLTQNETNLFKGTMLVTVQIKMLTYNEEVLVSKTSSFVMADTMNDEVMS